MPERRELERLFLDHLERIDRIIGSLCRRHGLAGAEAEDAAGWVRIRLIEDDYAVFRKFRGDSSLPTYLTVVVSRLFRDYRASRWGRWRPSSEARRRGEEAVRLETLVRRDGHSLDEAARRLRSAGRTELSDRELAELLAALPARHPLRPTKVELTPATAARASSSPTDEEVLAGEAAERREFVESALRRGLDALPPEDRLILRMRYWEDLKLAEVARALGLEQKPIYRRVDRCLARLRELLESEGVSGEEVAAVLDGVPTA